MVVPFSGEVRCSNTGDWVTHAKLMVGAKSKKNEHPTFLHNFCANALVIQYALCSMYVYEGNAGNTRQILLVCARMLARMLHTLWLRLMRRRLRQQQQRMSPSRSTQCMLYRLSWSSFRPPPPQTESQSILLHSVDVRAHTHTCSTRTRAHTMTSEHPLLRFCMQI